MAKYIKREMADMNGTGKTRAYYKLQIYRNLSQDEVIDKCAYPGSGVTRAMMKAVLTTLADELPRLLGMGYSVTIDGIGTFSVKLGIKEDKEPEDFEEKSRKRNAQSIMVNGISFRANKELIRKTDQACDLERGGESRLRQSKYSLEERIALANEFIERNNYMGVMEYAALTGLSSFKASIELRELSQRPDAGFKAEGRGSHKLYVKAK